MCKKVVALFLILFVMCIGITASTEEKSSEKPIAHINFSSWIKESFTVSPSNKRVAYAAVVDNKWLSLIHI